MSDLYRSAMSARLAKLPTNLPPIEGTEDDEEEEETDSLGSLSSIPGPGLGPPAMPATKRPVRKNRDPNPNFAPVSAASYFDDAHQVTVPVRNLDCRVYYTPPKYADGTVMVCHHGAGYSGLTFACFAKEVSEMSKGECGVLAFDARRHGKTVQITGPEDENLSVDVLVGDLIEIIKVIFPTPAEAPSFLLIGHSMGGSVITRCCPLLLEQKYRVVGVTVIDVVEGSAMDALPHMHNLLNARPDGFESLEEAIEWHISTKTIRNPYSARISIPAIFVPTPPESRNVYAYSWRTPLRSTALYWTSWFLGLSGKFLSARTARLLVLAGTDRLDKELMIGQMQGKFQMVVIPNTGHMVQEDDPTRLAEIMIEFWQRNERVVVGIKKVGDL